MSDITSLNNMAGANPALAKPAPAPEPQTIQNAVGQPLNTAQSAVTQPPTSSYAEWKREADPNGGRKSSQSGAVSNQPQLTNTVDHLNQHMRNYNTHLLFVVDDTYQQVVVRIVDQDTKEVVRQIPSETTLALAKFFDDLAAQQSQTMPSSITSSGNDSKPLKVEGLLLQVTV